MTDPYYGEIRRVAFNFAPRGWALCNGQLLSIASNQPLFALLGTTYGGNGVTTFGLPDLRGRAPVHPQHEITWGTVGGEEQHRLTLPELPAHTHNVRASDGAADRTSPQGGYWAASQHAAYGTGAAGTMSDAAIGSTGGGQPHENRPPFLVVNYIIATQGIWPSRN